MNLRFGVSLWKLEDRASWMEKSRRAEDLGYHVITVPDHIDMPSPFLACVLAAEATSSVQVGTFVSNTSFYSPALFARDVITTAQLTGGRLEVGLGAGWKKREFDAAGIPFEAPGKRVDRLVATLDEVTRAWSVLGGPTAPDRPPLMIGGNGDRVLRLAAKRADIVSFAGTIFDPQGRGMQFLTEQQMDERVALVDAELRTAGRDAVRRNIIVLRTQVTNDRPAALEDYSRFLRGTLSPEQVGELPAVLIGSPEQIAEQLIARRERFGFNYITVQESALDTFAKVIALLS
ncbi:TIGR03621 family F420-dependent LLM class oxidoreductase [Streptomyces sp. H27-D2]|uniref:TIGR03621 family F420-dependent LLM class oxidoreductase n=1 Tax=Streptomyces sp. H27-D2 TaxID=3046304 RepID=UPI002DB945EC|nr:TIGR03621 family F420-dependent LLM class oxidoreductase [Streptomyces sp. H27-D2]MEC4019772.1 TIGR03621 family F420-dependent LLM class oxidoreductase [Streptomyces sp. H27-D2]